MKLSREQNVLRPQPEIFILSHTDPEEEAETPQSQHLKIWQPYLESELKICLLLRRGNRHANQEHEKVLKGYTQHSLDFGLFILLFSLP